MLARRTDYWSMKSSRDGSPCASSWMCLSRMSRFRGFNDADEFVRIHGYIWYLAVGKMVLKVSAVAVPIAAVGLGWWRGWVPGRLA